MEQYHTIGKLLLELQLPSTATARPLQEKVSAICKDGLLSALSALLDSWAGPDTLLCIDRLEIDLGTCTPQSLEKELSERIIASLREHYPSMQGQQQLEPGMERRPLAQGYFDSWLYFLEYGLLPNTTHMHDVAAWEAGVLETLATASPAMEKCRRLLQTQPVAISRMLMQFSPQFVRQWIQAYGGPAQQPLLQVARIWEQRFYDPAFVTLLRNTPGLTLPPPPERTAFRRQLDEWSIRRILRPAAIPAPAALLEELITASVGRHQGPLYIQALQQLQPLPGEDGQLLKTALGALQDKYAADNTQSSNPGDRQTANNTATVNATQKTSGADKEESNKVITTGHAEAEHTSAAIREEIPATDERKNIQSHAAAQASESSPAHKDAHTQPGETSPLTRRDISVPEQGPQAPATTTAASEEQATIKQPAPTDTVTERRKPGTPPDGFSTYISNAGLVLLHPYLHILFDALGLLDKRAFKSATAQDKAVQLLGFLACGDTDIPEYELVFPKLLCGLLPEDPVDRFIELTEQDKTEADELLTAVIDNWNALGGTSADGLRGNFLTREGRLKWQEEEWRLRVTQQSYDLLLNRLPWGLSVVRLPWMPWVLKTEWV